MIVGINAVSMSTHDRFQYNCYLPEFTHTAIASWVRISPCKQLSASLIRLSFASKALLA